MKYLYQWTAVQFLIATAYAETNISICPSEGIRHNCFAEFSGLYAGKYAGQWVSGQYAGFGTYFLPNGDRYVGQFRVNQYHGRGTYYFLSGERYVGELRNGKKQGQGIFYAADGSILTDGDWDKDIFLSPARNLKDPGQIALDWKDHIQKEIASLQQKPQTLHVWSDVISKAVVNSLDRWLQDDSGLNISEIPPSKLPPPISIFQEKWESDKEFADRLAGLLALQQNEIEQILEKNRKLNEQRNKNIRIINEIKLAKLQILPQVSKEFTRLAVAEFVPSITLGLAEFDSKTVVLYLNLGIGGQPISKYEFKDAPLELRKIALTDLNSLWFYLDTFVNADGLFGVKGIKIAGGNASAYGVQVTGSVENQSLKLFGIDLTKYAIKQTAAASKLQDQPLVQPEVPSDLEAISNLESIANNLTEGKDKEATLIRTDSRLIEEIKLKENEETKFLEENSKLKEEVTKRKEVETYRLPEEKKETEQRRQEQVKRLKGLGEASTGPTDKASAAKASAPSGTYLGRLRARIKPNITFPVSLLQTVKGNPEAEVEVICNPSGEILSKKLIRSSGNLDWDQAVINAIEKTGTLPRDENGNMPPKINFVFRPRD